MVGKSKPYSPNADVHSDFTIVECVSPSSNSSNQIKIFRTFTRSTKRWDTHRVNYSMPGNWLGLFGMVQWRIVASNVWGIKRGRTSHFFVLKKSSKIYITKIVQLPQALFFLGDGGFHRKSSSPTFFNGNYFRKPSLTLTCSHPKNGYNVRRWCFFSF